MASRPYFISRVILIAIGAELVARTAHMHPAWLGAIGIYCVFLGLALGQER